MKDACFSKLASFYIVIRFSCFYLYTDLFLCLIYTYICIQYCIDTWPGLYTESFVTFSEDMPFFSLVYSHGSLRFLQEASMTQLKEECRLSLEGLWELGGFHPHAFKNKHHHS